jgi:hypothetical protein
VRGLARVEARRHLWSPLVLPFAAFTAFTLLTVGGQDWSGATYSELPISFMPLATLAFFSCLRAAGRDHRPDLPPLAEEAPLDRSSRTLAHLLGATVFPALAVAGVVVGEIASWLEGGYWIGDTPWRTDSAHHTLPELFQPVALVALGAAAGVAAGRRFRRRTPIGIVVALFAFLQTAMWWAFQFVPLLAFSPLQAQPISQRAGPLGVDPATLPAHWHLVGPDTYQEHWMHQYVDQPLAAAHGLYLVGLTTVLVGHALRPRGMEVAAVPVLGRRLRLIGWTAVALGLVLQFWALGWVFTPGGIGEAQSP